MPTAATIEDVLEISKTEALKSGRKLIGLTVSEPRYVSVPDESDAAAVFEFVVDVQLLDGITQAIVPGATGQGLAVVENVLIAHEAVGEIIADLNVPVEIEKTVTGQLQVVNRAKVQLPSLSVRAFTYRDLKLEHLAELDISPAGEAFDPFGIGVDLEAEIGGASTRLFTSAKFAQSTLAQLAEDDAGNFIGLGVNVHQRTIQTTTREWSVTAEERIPVADEMEATT